MFKQFENSAKLDKCLDMITAAIHAPLYTKPPTTQSLLDVAVGEL